MNIWLDTYVAGELAQFIFDGMVGRGFETDFDLVEAIEELTQEFSEVNPIDITQTDVEWDLGSSSPGQALPYWITRVRVVYGVNKAEYP